MNDSDHTWMNTKCGPKSRRRRRRGEAANREEKQKTIQTNTHAHTRMMDIVLMHAVEYEIQCEREFVRGRRHRRRRRRARDTMEEKIIMIYCI